MAPATVGRPGRLAPRSVNSKARQTPYRERAGVFLARAAPGASNHKEEPKMTTNQYPDGEPATERVVVLQLLRKDRSEWWSRTEVLRKLHDIDPDAIVGSLEHLARLGLLDRQGARFKASKELRYIDVVLDLIGI